MKEFKGTPGPWKIGGAFGNDKDSHSDFLVIAQSCVVVDGCGCCGSPYLGGETEAEQFANARLIVAAPKMLEALTSTLDEIGFWLSQQKPELRDKLVSAVAEALGESQ